VQREVKRAVRRSGIRKRATYHTFRHSFATEALRGGCDIRKLRHVIGHKDVRTTTICLHVVEQTGLFIRRPSTAPTTWRTTTSIRWVRPGLEWTSPGISGSPVEGSTT
jgi:hypothetical protein